MQSRERSSRAGGERKSDQEIVQGPDGTAYLGTSEIEERSRLLSVWRIVPIRGTELRTGVENLESLYQELSSPSGECIDPTDCFRIMSNLITYKRSIASAISALH